MPDFRLDLVLQRYRLLVLNKFDYIPFSKTGADLLFEGFNRVYGPYSIILTTSLPF